MFNAVLDVHRFLDTGGPVLWAIGLLSSIMATLIIERYWFFRHDFNLQAKTMLEQWNGRQDRASWAALHIREVLIAEISAKLTLNLSIIKVLVMVCPLFGLIGTVTGMMSVFDVIALLGTGNPRAMATGISQATIPTMAGMMIMLPGLYFSHELQREKSRRVEQISKQLTID